MSLHKTTLLLFSAILLFLSTTAAQKQNKDLVLKDGVPLYEKLGIYIRTNGKAVLERECANGCFFLKFEVDRNGNVSDIVSNNWAWPVLDTLVQSALQSTNGQWVTPKNGAKSKTYFLPVLFSTGYCKPGTGTNPTTAAELLASIPDFKDTAAIVDAKRKGMIDNFLHMNDFENKSDKLPRPMSTASFECILLPTIYLTSPKI
jgi:hypothetical protein